jgi:phytoene/squalene synthetase
MRRFLLTFDLCCELSEEEFRRIVTADRDQLDDDDSYEGMEAELLVYGRRTGHVDTRLVAAVLARFTRAS